MAFVCLVPPFAVGEDGATTPPPPTAEDRTTFREQFIKNHDRDRFKEQAALVKENKDLVKGEVSVLVEEAMQGNTGFAERMRLLDIARAMAALHEFWNKDGAPLKHVDPYIQKELRAQEKREAELMKWEREERFPGNFVMMRYNKELTEDDLPPVLYPHWLHRIYYECRVCHDSIFRMKRYSTDITQKSLEGGRHCSECHDGKEAFGLKGNCKKCHLAGTPEAARLHDPTLVDHKEVKRVAVGLGVEWKHENLGRAGLPFDKYRFVDWIKLKELGVLRPKASLSKKGGAGDKAGPKKRNNTIYFSANSEAVSDVVFDHKLHTDWIGCKSCHPMPFSEKLGETNVLMSKFSKGRFCGKCHGRVSFTFADCKRCHHHDVPPEAALIRKGKE